MNPPEDQHDPSRAPRYVDPEEFDMSEQEFSASLENDGQRPRFIVDSAAQSEPNSVWEQPSSTDIVEARSSSEEKPGYAERRHEGGGPQLQTDPDDPGINAAQASDWREQVSAKVNSYKSRRPRQERFPSLQLQFDPADRLQRSPETTSFVPQIEEEPIRPLRQPAHDLPVLLESTARVIEFPRLAPPPRTDELAEPVLDRPRILDVPELLPAPPAMGGILIEPGDEPQPERRPGFDLPLKTADLQRRLWAAAVDALIVLMAAAAFAYVFLRFTSVLPPWRTDLELIAGLIAVLWPAYQYSLLVYSATTPGLRFARLTIQRFDGTPAPRKLRRWRVLASFLSALSVGLGYAWCFLDEDQLSWHDRITRTHLAPAEPA